MRQNYVWLSDTHFWYWSRAKLLNLMLDERPKGLFLTGDISNSAWLLLKDLKFLAKGLNIPIYFVLGNHCNYGSSFETTSQQVSELCNRYSNLKWLTQSDVISLNDDTAIIGDMGWYDCNAGIKSFIKFTFDWFMISDFRRLPNWAARFAKFKQLAQDSANNIAVKLREALKNHKTVYLLTHFPPYKEASIYRNWFDKLFYEAYNTNETLGKELDVVMSEHKDSKLIVLSGHTHVPTTYIRGNIECRVGKGSYITLSEDEIIHI